MAIVINKYVEIKLCNILNVGGGGTSTILNGCVQEGINSWFSPLARVLPTLGINLNDRTSPQTLKSKLQTKFINAWEERIMQSKKLRTYTKFKTHYRMEPYLLHLKDRHKRAQVCRIRVSAHTLAIEKGRYKRNNEDTFILRNCKFCQNHIEDEQHFLINCSKYVSHREKFFSVIINKVPNFGSLTENEKMIWLFTMEDHHLINTLATYIKCCLDLRGQKHPPQGNECFSCYISS